MISTTFICILSLVCCYFIFVAIDVDISLSKTTFSQYLWTSQSQGPIIQDHRHLTDTFLFYNNSMLHELYVSKQLRKNQLIRNKKGWIYVLYNGTKHWVPDFLTIIANDYDLRKLILFSNEDTENIPTGEDIPLFTKTYNESFDFCPCHARSRLYDENAIKLSAKHRHNICFYNNTVVRKFFASVHSRHLSDLEHSIIDSSKLSQYPHCDAYIELLPPYQESIKGNDRYHYNYHKYICPESCMPKPYTAIRVDLLLNYDNMHPDIPITCSMTVNMTRHLFPQAGNISLEVTRQEKHKEHMISSLLKHIVRRRLQECKEKEFWPHLPLDSSRQHDTTRLNHQHIVRKYGIGRRNVFGLILWIGSSTRIEMSRQQIEILWDQHLNEEDYYISGYIASDEQYSCRLGSTVPDWSKYDAKRLKKILPPNIYDQAPHGWACSQRRPLRALGHTMLLYDPQFLLVVDDDSYVNINQLKRHQPLTQFIRTYMKRNPVTVGFLSDWEWKKGGGLITKKGLYFGGGGYLLGRRVIERLNSNELPGPTSWVDTYRDLRQMTQLTMLKDAFNIANRSCSKSDQCLKLMHKGKESHVYHDIGSKGILSVRVIDICINMLAEEGTFYHSDHSLPRCLFHAAYATPLHADCNGSYIDPTNASKIDNLFVGMCHYDLGCNASHTYQLTCHRKVANRENLSLQPESSLVWLPPEHDPDSQVVLRHKWTDI